MVITGSDIVGIKETQLCLQRNFKMKDLGHLHYLIGSKIQSDSSGYSLSQATYASDIIHRSGISDDIIELTPLQPNTDV